MPTERRLVDNRVFLLGLDKLYRDAIKQHEREELLMCARRVAAKIDVAPADVPIEGYYTEDEQLTEYFRLVRALQNAPENATSAVGSLPEFQRLRDVMSAPLYGRPEFGNRLLPAGVDPLSQALLDTLPDWSLKALTRTARDIAIATDDISLVGLAARVHDAVVLTAARESVVLYALPIPTAARKPPRIKYVWDVDKELAQPARRFIDTFNTLFGEDLPQPDASQAARYWHANRDTKVLGRCVRLGWDDSTSPTRHYHWAICRADAGELITQEFWHTEVWTTDRYRSAVGRKGSCPEF